MTTERGSAAPKLSQKAAERKFKQEVQADVSHDIDIAINHPGKQMKFVVTPSKVAYRTLDRSTCRLDLTPNCREFKWLIGLYKALKPKGSEITCESESVVFETEKGPEEIWMPVVTISFP